MTDSVGQGDVEKGLGLVPQNNITPQALAEHLLYAECDPDSP